MKTLIVMGLIAAAGCSDDQNLGDRYALHSARWAVAAGAPGGNVSASQVAVDAAGDLVAAGMFQGTIDFGATTLTSPELGASWVGKRSGIDGAELWTLPLAGANVSIEALAVTPQREVIIAGGYAGTQDFGGQMLIAQQSDGFVAKYDPDGNLMWVTGLDRRSQASATGLAVGSDGQIIVSAQFTGTISLPDRLISGGQCVVAALAPDGRIRWGRQLPVGGQVHVTSDGHAIVAGVVSESTTFGSVMLDLTRDPDLFVASFDREGALAWVRTFGTFAQRHLDLVWTLDADGDVAAVANGPDLHASAPRDMLLDSAGAPVWSASLASGAGLAFAVAATPDGVISSGQITSDGFDPGDGVHVGAMYLIARDATGALADAHVYGDPSLGTGDAITALATGPSGELGFAAYIDQPVDFGSGRVEPPGGAGHRSLVLGVLPP